jgi:heme/copper-type cytochrome/quinol oxidase subunit 3
VADHRIDWCTDHGHWCRALAAWWPDLGRFLAVLIGTAIVLYTMFMWWRDVVKESHAGDHTPVVQLHLRYGMLMFIASEIMFFVAWFWAFFEASLYADSAIQAARVEVTQGVWPPAGIEVFDPWHLPLLNTLILLLSGTTVTWAHHALINDDRKGLKWGLICTIALGVLFSCVQAYEYAVAPFAFKAENGGNIYSSTFFMATGFHGFHVIDRYDLPDRLPVPCAAGALHAEAAFRLRGGCLVLALRGRGLAVPVCLHLRLGQLRRNHRAPLAPTATTLTRPHGTTGSHAAFFMT